MHIFLNNIVHVTTDVITSTDSYKKLSFVRKKIVRSWNNCKAIDNSLKIIDAIGYEKWEKQTNSSFINKNIIIELIAKKKQMT